MSGINLGIKGFIVIETVSRLLHLDFIDQELEMYRRQTADDRIWASGGTMAIYERRKQTAPLTPKPILCQPLPSSSPTHVSTPPSLPLSVPDTPTHNRLSTLQPFSSLNGYFVETAFVDAAKELKEKFVAVSPQTFLEKYVPEYPGMPQVDRASQVGRASFTKVYEQKLENAMYEPLIDDLKPFLKSGWSMVNTSASLDPDSGFFNDHRIKPDISVYSDGKPSNNNLCRSCDMDTFLELEVDAEIDRFLLDKSNPTDTSLERDGGVARDMRGQLVTYLNAMQVLHFRTHGFGVLILRKKCRLLCHTHSGIEVTAQFDYVSSRYLQTFFWRLLHAHPAPIWKVRIGNRFFYVSKPLTRNHHYPVGRGTRCFVAVDCETLQKCVLKDVWRVVGYHPEGEVYTRLHQHSVVNIPGIIVGVMLIQTTMLAGHILPYLWCIPTGSTIHEHKHYLIVLDVIGEPISNFRSTWELTKCILDATKAHRDAFSKAEMEQLQEISLMELSRYREDEGIRTYERMGTVQFMAARLFNDQPTARTVGDDLESFMLFFLWLAALYALNDINIGLNDDKVSTLYHILLVSQLTVFVFIKFQ
ncbi:hypothetical protein BT96DRAFT_1000753 [Gymnopus androsaceus JB14]|uniref:Fungal-type protein kinase domain-containing protein n=1 Tax=Gymnopus androsaceus JB14 TaxID=1447944 RepID=A0A6A4H1I6_9AGAR|nr:hypothetical protein BT96DRAFT_1000753 [Gymnopus androsaceus JB14]